MTTLPPELEALMPEPAKLVIDCEDCGGTGQTGESRYMGDFQPPESSRCDSCNGSGNWSVDHYTATQMREAILAATERAAKVCEGLSALSDKPIHDNDDCAAAIRGDRGGV